MVRKKRGKKEGGNRVISKNLILIIIIILIVFVLGFGFWKMTGKAVGDTLVRVNVTDLGVAPEIFFVSDIDSNSLSAGTFKIINFNFLVYAKSGVSTLPTTQLQVDNQIEGKLEKGSVTRSSNDASSMKCSFLETLNNYERNGETVSVNSYSCSVAMWYFDEPGNWDITASLTDSFSRNVVNNTHKGWIQALDSWDIAPSSVNWSNVVLGQENQKADADSLIKISNLGNTDVNDVQVNSTDLSGTEIIEERILAGWFAFAESDSCNGNSLIKDEKVSSGISVDHSFSTPSTPSSKNLEFCLKQVTGVSAQLYRSERDWELRASYI